VSRAEREALLFAKRSKNSYSLTMRRLPDWSAMTGGGIAESLNRATKQ
jgi:hypothetical protein